MVNNNAAEFPSGFRLRVISVLGGDECAPRIARSTSSGARLLLRSEVDGNHVAWLNVSACMSEKILGQEQEQNEGDPCVTNCSRSVIAWVALYEQSGRLAQGIDAKP